jgi:hypothetical protein
MYEVVLGRLGLSGLAKKCEPMPSNTFTFRFADSYRNTVQTREINYRTIYTSISAFTIPRRQYMTDSMNTSSHPS